MKKTAILILIATLTIFFCIGLASCASGENYDGFIVSPNEDGTYTLIGYTGEDVEVAVPAELADKAVTAIGNKAFANNAKIKKIILPDSIKSIGTSAFAGCTALTAVEGGAYTEIPSGAFSGCTALSSVALPAGLENIGYRAFSGCTALAKIDLPEAVKTVYHYAFADCTALSVFDIKGDGLSVYANAFAGCTALKSISTPVGGASDAVYKFSNGVMFSEDGKTLVSFIRTDREYKIPANVTAIAPGAFFEKYTLEALTVAEENTAFYADGGVVYSKDTKTLVVYPAGRTGDEYTVKSGVSAISDCAFSGNPLIKKITLADTVTAIGKSAFENCSSLAALECANVTATVGELAFSGCTAQNSYIVTDTAPAYKLIGGVLFSADETTLVSYPADKTETEYTVPATAKTVSPRAFALGANLSAIKVAQGNEALTSVGGALYSADKTVLIAVPAKLSGEISADGATVTVTAGAFEGCAAITKIVLPAGVTEIPANAFYGCAALSELTLNGTVVKIGNEALFGCDALKTVNYKGTQAQWASAKSGSTGNGVLDGITVNYN